MNEDITIKLLERKVQTLETHLTARESNIKYLRAVLGEAKPCTHMEGYVEKLEAERDALRDEVVAWTDQALGIAGTLKSLMAERDALRDRVKHLEECRLFDSRQAAAKYDNERVLRLRDQAERDALRKP
jgi:predicted  nucleic acid-binding Zn-ribbon protein